MKKIKIQLDKPEISDSEISKLKNFENVKNSFDVQNISMFKSFKFWGIASSVVGTTAIILSLLFYNKTQNIATNNIDSTKSVVVSPIPEADIPFEVHNIDNSKDTTISSELGSIIFIPADAFVSSKGEKLENNLIQIKFREFHNPFDFFVSGIPMQYDSAGQKYTFESAGMLEILAFNETKPVLLKNNKEIVVDLISNSAKTDFNLYQLDTNTGVWQNKGKDIVNVVKEENYVLGENNQTKNTVFENQIAELYKPILVNPKKYSFEVEMDDKLKPNFVNVEKVLFQIDDTKCKFDPVFYSISWEKIDVVKYDKSTFKLNLSRNDTTISLFAFPVYKKQDYNNAIEKYNQKLKENNKQKEEILSKRNSKINDENFEKINQNILSNGLNIQSFRQVRIPSLGIWNCDLPRLPEGTVVNPTFVNDSNQNIENKVIYVVDKSKNQLNTYDGNAPQVSVNTKAENVVWSLTNDNKISIPSQKSIKNVKPENDNKKHIFETKEYENIEGCKKIKELLDGKTEQTEIEKKKVETKTYPNPFTNYVTIDLSGEYECVVQLINSNGQFVDNIKFTGNKYEWKLDEYKSGNYIVVVLIPSINYKESFKIVKK